MTSAWHPPPKGEAVLVQYIWHHRPSGDLQMAIFITAVMWLKGGIKHGRKYCCTDHVVHLIIHWSTARSQYFIDFHPVHCIWFDLIWFEFYIRLWKPLTLGLLLRCPVTERCKDEPTQQTTCKIRSTVIFSVTLVDTWMTWSSQVRCSFMMQPRNLKLQTCSLWVSYYDHVQPSAVELNDWKNVQACIHTYIQFLGSVELELVTHPGVTIFQGQWQYVADFRDWRTNHTDGSIICKEHWC